MRLRKSSLVDAELNITPMIDIVFLLISFFTLVINFTQSEQHENVRLPGSELAQPSETMPSEPLTLQVTADEQIFLGMTVCALEGEGNQALRSFSTALRDELRVLAAISRVEPKEITVVIRADEDVRTGYVQRLIQCCQNNGLEQFILRARQIRFDD